MLEIAKCSRSVDAYVRAQGAQTRHRCSHVTRWRITRRDNGVLPTQLQRRCKPGREAAVGANPDSGEPAYERMKPGCVAASPAARRLLESSQRSTLNAQCATASRTLVRLSRRSYALKTEAHVAVQSVLVLAQFPPT